MNCEQANKNIHLTQIMERLGYKVYQKHKGGNEWLYLSPFRNEATPSFYINVAKNCYFDHGEGQGAFSVVDFAIRYLQTNGRANHVSDALNWLSSLGFSKDITTKNLFPSVSTALSASKKEKENDIRDLEFIRAYDVKHPAIFQYLEGRGITRHLIRIYLKEVQYRNLKKDKVFFGFAMQNRAGGWELRSASDKPVFKSALIKRDITYIQSKDNNSNTVEVYEGTADFLSSLALFSVLEPVHDAIIMHSLSSFKDTLELIRENSYSSVQLFLDNDASGKKAAVKFTNELEIQVINQSGLYSGYKDLNEALKAKLEHPEFPATNLG